MWTAFGNLQKWHRAVFGQPALLLVGEGLCAATGPDSQVATRIWEAYSGPTAAGRTAISRLQPFRRLGELPTRILINDRYIGVRTVSRFYLVARDEVGPYVIGRSLLPMELQDRTIYREMVAVVEALRQEQDQRRRTGAS